MYVIPYPLPVTGCHLFSNKPMRNGKFRWATEIFKKNGGCLVDCLAARQHKRQFEPNAGSETGSGG